MGVHGEAPVAPYEIETGDGRLRLHTVLSLAQIRFERTIELRDSGIEIHETVESLAAFDRPIGWTQHVTLGPPFLECGVTKFETSATKSKVFVGQFGSDDYLEAAAVFDWPMAPRTGTGFADLRVFNSSPSSSGFTAHLMNPLRRDAFFNAFHPGLQLSFGYRWDRADFPWLGIWEENRSRTHAPWNGVTIARGLEFGVSPMPETRRRMVERGSLFGVPAYRWLPAAGRLEVRYSAGFTTGHPARINSLLE
jgi:hypothetical protein